MSGLNFTAIDFETANGSRASACSVGLAKVVGGEVVETASWLIHPPAGHDDFAPRNIQIHGIKADHVATAPYWSDVLPEVMAFSSGTPFIAHNAAFDGDVFRAATTESGLVVPDTTFYCSYRLAEQWLDLENHQLPTVADALGVPLLNHHDAGADAAACANIVLGIAQRCDCHTVDGLWPGGPTRTRARAGTGTRAPAAPRPASKKLSELPQANPNADPTNPFYGHVFVFTGELANMERDAAMEAVARYGASNGNGITKKTTVLVAATTGTGKERKAQTYIDAGQPIKIITEREFHAMLDHVLKPAALSAGAVPVAAPDPMSAPDLMSATDPISGPRPSPERPIAAVAPQPAASAILTAVPIPAAQHAQSPAPSGAPRRPSAKTDRGTVLTEAMRKRSPKTHRRAGVLLLSTAVLVGIILAAVPVAGVVLLIGSIAFGVYGNVVHRRIAWTLEQETAEVQAAARSGSSHEQ